MSKRFQHFQINQQFGKKPKLEISYTKANDVNSSGLSKNFQSKFPSTHQAKNQEQRKSLTNEWDDDDDEVILLASQAYEAMEQNSQQIIIEHQQHTLGLNDLTFTKFGAGVETSTQVINLPEKPQAGNSNDLNEDDDDGLFCSINEYAINDKRKINQESKPSTSNMFKVPKVASVQNKESTKFQEPKKKDPKDIQLEYVQSRLEFLRKENEKLSKDLSDLNNKFQTKDGEVSMLRYEIKNLKQINDKLRIEKMNESEIIKKEWQNKIYELEKLVAAHQTELQFKKAEVLNLKSKRLSDTNSFSERNIPGKNCTETLKALGSTKEIKSTFFNLHLLIDNIDLEEKSKKRLKIPLQIFKNVKLKKYSLNLRERVFYEELKVFQDILAQVQHCDILDDNIIEKYKNEINESLKKTLPNLQEYVYDLDYPKYRDSSALVEYKFLSEKLADFSFWSNKTIFDDELLFPQEKGLPVRRYIAAFGLLCENLNPIINILSTEKIGDNTFLEILIKIIESIGFSEELYNYFGLIESFGFLLKMIIKCNNITKNIEDINIVNFLKQIVFCRPNIRPLIQISESLKELSEERNETNDKILNKLCSKTENGLFSINEYYKILQFTPNSCILQVYGVLLEVLFEQNIALPQQKIQYLIQILNNHMQFLRNCIDRKVHWIHEMPISSNATNSISRNNSDDQKICDCYARVSTSFIILFHLLLKHWINDVNCIDFRKISKLSRVGILLLCVICKINYRREVFQIGGFAVRNRIKTIYDYLNEHKNLLQFKSSHFHSLEFIKSSHVMADPLQQYIEDNKNDNSVSDGDKIWADCVLEEFN